MLPQFDLATACDAGSGTGESGPGKAVTARSRRTLSLPDISASKGSNEPHDADSGYGTGSTATPKSLEKQSSTTSKSDRGSNIGRLLRLSANQGSLQEFEQVVPKETVNRFKSIAGLLQGALVEYMRKHFNTHHPMSMRLMVLGKSAEDAQPWIIVFCHKSRERRTRRFFKKSFARGLCQPKDPATLSFEVLVIGHALEPTGSPVTNVWTDYDFATATLSGIPIQISQQNQIERGTLGGLIKIIDAEGDYKICGLTAGHLLLPASDTRPETLFGSEDGSDDGSDSSLSEDEAEMDYGQLGPANVIAVVDGDSHDSAMQDPKPPPVAYWKPFGHIDEQSAPPSPDNQLSSTASDWALITVHQRADLKPNLLRTTSATKHRAADLIIPAKEKMNFSTTRHVLLNSCGKESQVGTLSPLPCSVWLGHSKGGFVDAFSLKMGDESEIRRGDSGSWIVEPVTLEVYGHLVASDGFGDGYVMPLLPTLEEICKSLGAKAVELPTAVDIACLQGEALLSQVGTLLPEREPEEWYTMPSTPPFRPRSPTLFEPPSVPQHVRETQDVATPRGSLPIGDSGYASASVTPRSHVELIPEAIKGSNVSSASPSIASTESTPSLVSTNGDTPQDTPNTTPEDLSPPRGYRTNRYSKDGEPSITRPTTVKERIKRRVSEFFIGSRRRKAATRI